MTPPKRLMPTTPAETIGIEKRIDDAVEAIYAEAAKATDACGLVIDRDRLPSILLEIAARSSARMIAAAASEKSDPHRYRAERMMLFVDKVAMRSHNDLERLLADADPDRRLAP